MTLGEILRLARERLSEAGITHPPLDARLIVEHFTGTTRADAMARPEMPVGGETLEVVEWALVRRAGGEPVHRILGFREFYGLTLKLSKGTLEPRPDTETLVDALLPFVRAFAARETCRILDLGTGTGAIALALLSQVSNTTATGVDLSEDALRTASDNAASLGLEDRFTAFRSDWFSHIAGRYHAIAANPPYIETRDIETLQSEVRNFDPVQALEGGEDGLDAYRAIADKIRDHIEPDGFVGLEIGSRQKASVTSIFESAGFSLIDAKADLAGHDRVLIFR